MRRVWLSRIEKEANTPLTTRHGDGWEGVDQHRSGEPGCKHFGRADAQAPCPGYHRLRIYSTFFGSLDNRPVGLIQRVLPSLYEVVVRTSKCSGYYYSLFKISNADRASFPGRMPRNPTTAGHQISTAPHLREKEKLSPKL